MRAGEVALDDGRYLCDQILVSELGDRWDLDDVVRDREAEQVGAGEGKESGLVAIRANCARESCRSARLEASWPPCLRLEVRRVGDVGVVVVADFDADAVDGAGEGCVWGVVGECPGSGTVTSWPIGRERLTFSWKQYL
jgi:hypothetical protein